MSVQPAPDGSARASQEKVLILVCRLGERRLGILGAAVQRILPMAELTPLPDADNGVVGILNVHGSILPVVDPRLGLGLAPSSPDPTQYLVLVSGEPRYLLWVDAVEDIAHVPAGELRPTGATSGPLMAAVPDVSGPVLPILSTEALRPCEPSRQSWVGGTSPSERP